jgi:hypothetical protein
MESEIGSGAKRIELRGAPLAARSLERRFGRQCSRTEGNESVLFADALGFFFYFSWNPLRKWNFPTHMLPRRSVLFSNLRNLMWWESRGYPD